MSIKAVCYYVPPLGVFIILCASYYIYVVIFCVQLVGDRLEFYLYLVFYNISFVMLSWSFLACVFITPEEPPEQYQLTDDEAERWARLRKQDRQIFLQSMVNKKGLVIQTLQNGHIRYCTVCQQIKPDRAHHCSTCEICVLKMDHHCPWLNNCIGFSNYKCFYLLMFYWCIYCIYVTSTMLKYIAFSDTETKQNISVVVGFVLSFIFGLIAAIFLMYNTEMLATNETVLEGMREPRFIQEDVTYNLGCKRNFLEVFGEDCLLWPLPFFTGLGTGYTFELRSLSSTSISINDAVEDG